MEDDDSELDFSGKIDMFGNLLANTIGSVRNATNTVQTAIGGGNQTTTTTGTPAANGGINPSLVIGGIAVAIGAFLYFRKS